ncbi:hypothetical protein DFH09DRAFT_1459582 [Mycena vulgaris]|nr:hypothetical protein DFH09DRAFT_1459582 [Mycena vulgaris]
MEEKSEEFKALGSNSDRAGISYDLLRQEIRAAKDAADGGDLEYNTMPLLNAFIKRWATEDYGLPLVSEMTTSAGHLINQLPLKKGQIVMVAMASYQRLESVWGADADQFRPSLWLGGGPSHRHAVGQYANLFAHLIALPRVFAQVVKLTGFRFLGAIALASDGGLAHLLDRLLEVQAIITELVSAISFTLPADGSSVRSRYWGTEEIPVTTDGVKGVYLPLTPL